MNSSKYVICVLLGLGVFSLLFAQDHSLTFKQKKITIIKQDNTKVVVNVEIAENQQQHTYGLMFRKILPINNGMLFIFPTEAYRNFLDEKYGNRLINSVYRCAWNNKRDL